MIRVVEGSSMNQEKNKVNPQVFYCDRWVDRDSFRAFVYSTSDLKLANSYKEYENLIATGLWFDTKAKAMDAKQVPQAEVIELKKPKARKPNNGANS